MANTTRINTRIMLRNDTLANWGESTLSLAPGEVAIASINNELAEVRIGNNTTWANSRKLNIGTDQVSGLTEMISALVGDGAKKYQVVANGEGGNSWKLQEAALSGGSWVDVDGSTWTVDFTAINNAITNLSTDVAYLGGAINAANAGIGAVSAAVDVVSAGVDDLSNAIDAANAGIGYLSGQIDTTNSTLNTVSSDYLKATDFNAISTAIGLDAASDSNKVVTLSDIADLAGAMHFRGAVTPKEGETDLEALARAITDPASGDVAIITSTSKEYVYNGTSWIELGDEVLYATKAEVAAISVDLTADIAGLEADVAYLSNQISTVADTYATKAELNDVSIALSTDYQGKIDGLSDTLTETRIVLDTVSSDYLKSADKTELIGTISTVSAEAIVSANSYTDTEIGSLSTTTAALVAETSAATVNTVVGLSTDLSSADTVYGAKKYTDDKIEEIVTGFLILDCGNSALRTGEPTAPFA